MSDLHLKTIADLRAMLLESGKSQEEVDKIKGKANLVAAVLQIQDNDVSDDIEVANLEVVNQEKKISMLDPEWQDHIMGQFTQDELQDGYPTVYGLRRVVQDTFGQIVSSIPVKLESLLSESTPGRAYCVYEVKVMTKSGFMVSGAAAGAFAENTDDVYAVFPEAIAEVRAEARALRKMLNLKCVSADELTKKDTRKATATLKAKAEEAKAEKKTDGIWVAPAVLDTLSPIQTAFIQKMCKRLQIDVNKFINSESWKYNDLQDVTAQHAQDMIDKLNQYQSNSNTSLNVPTELSISDK